MAENIETKIKGYCPTCLQESEFEYIGPIGDDIETFQLYNCGNKSCRSTVSLESIREHNRKSTPSSQ